MNAHVKALQKKIRIGALPRIRDISVSNGNLDQCWRLGSQNILEEDESA
jgi:hypothetical protein